MTAHGSGERLGPGSGPTVADPAQPMRRNGRLSAMARWIVALSLAVGVLLLPLDQVAACRCVAAAPAHQAANADAAFAGTVVDLEHPPGTTEQVIATFAVDAVAHGVLGDRVPVIAFVGEDACGVDFALQERWMIIADYDGAMLRTGLCDGDARLEAGQPPPLAMQPVSSSLGSVPPGAITLLVGASAALVVIASLLALRRGRRRSS